MTNQINNMEDEEIRLERKTAIYICPDFNDSRTYNLERQEETLKEFARTKEYGIEKILIDEEDNMVFKDRKGLQKLINLILEQKINTVVVYRKTNISNFSNTLKMFEFLCQRRSCEIIEYKE